MREPQPIPDNPRRSLVRTLALPALVLLSLVACSREDHSAANGTPNPASMAGAMSGLQQPGSGPSSPLGASGRAGSVVIGTGGGAGINAGGSGMAGMVVNGTAGAGGNRSPTQPPTAGSTMAGRSAATDGNGAPAAGASGASGAAAAGGSTAPAAGPFMLTAVDVEMYSATEVQFPDSALPPTNQSPGFMWSGVPPQTKSLVLTFTDVSGSAYKWIVWDMPPTTTGLPANMSDAAMPPEVPGASQLGSLGNQGYAGPCCANNMYEFVLWALDVDKLPDVSRMSTAQIHNDVLPMYELAKTEPVKMRRR